MAGRAQVTVRNAPAALCGLAVNVLLLVVLVPSLGIAGAGLALVGAYAVMLVAMWALTHKLFPVAFEWGRLLSFVLVVGGLTTAGELLLPTDGVVGFIDPGARAGRAAAGAGRDPLLPAGRAARRPRPAQSKSARPIGGASRRLNSSAPSRRPSPRRGSSVALTCLR